MTPTAPAGALTELRLAELHGSLSSPISDSMNFLNEVAHRYPDAVSSPPAAPTRASSRSRRSPGTSTPTGPT